MRRLSALALLSAWLCASGAMLDLAQVCAWAQMFAGYSRTESVLEAVKETFDPGKPCAICKAVKHARDDARDHAPAVPQAGVQKLVLMFEHAEIVVAVSAAPTWPSLPPMRGEMRGADVPVPPPRGRLLAA